MNFYFIHIYYYNILQTINFGFKNTKIINFGHLEIFFRLKTDNDFAGFHRNSFAIYLNVIQIKLFSFVLLIISYKSIIFKKTQIMNSPSQIPPPFGPLHLRKDADAHRLDALMQELFQWKAALKNFHRSQNHGTDAFVCGVLVQC